MRFGKSCAGFSKMTSFADAAVACGYYDQAHMARDFGYLAETSPTAWRRYAGVLTPLFVSR